MPITSRTLLQEQIQTRAAQPKTNPGPDRPTPDAPERSREGAAREQNEKAMEVLAELWDSKIAIAKEAMNRLWGDYLKKKGTYNAWYKAKVNYTNLKQEKIYAIQNLRAEQAQMASDKQGREDARERLRESGVNTGGIGGIGGEPSVVNTQQQEFIQSLRDRMDGKGPSAALEAGKAQSQRAVSMAQALAAGAAPGLQAAGLRQALQQGSAAQASVAGQTAVARATEQQQAAEQLGKALGVSVDAETASRGQRIQLELGFQSTELAYAQLRQQASQFNLTFDQMRRQYDQALARGDRAAMLGLLKGAADVAMQYYGISQKNKGE